MSIPSSLESEITNLSNFQTLESNFRFDSIQWDNYELEYIESTSIVTYIIPLYSIDSMLNPVMNYLIALYDGVTATYEKILYYDLKGMDEHSRNGKTYIYYLSTDNYIAMDITYDALRATWEIENGGYGGQAMGWWQCTVNCYSEATDACSNDPECNFLCTFTPGCQTMIAVACGAHCW